jgi:peptidoglycan/LPS O-acetylase OafA/YrhL
MKAAKDRLPSLDGLRGIAAVLVMFYHFNLSYLPQAHFFYFERAYLSVDLFLLLSGFVIAHVYGQAMAASQQYACWPFLKARFARIYPLFALTILVLIAIARTSTFSNPPGVSFSVKALFLQPLLLQQWFPELNWNYPSWSISTEAEAYIFFAVAAPYLIKGRHPWALAVACLIGLVIVAAFGNLTINFPLGQFALLRTLCEFALGTLIYRAHSANPGSNRLWALGMSALMVACFRFAHVDLLIVGALAALIYYSVAAFKGPISGMLNSKLTVALGRWSYSIYLWHIPIHVAAASALVAVGHPVNTLDRRVAILLLCVTAVGVVGISAASYHFYELPMQRWVRGLPARGLLRQLTRAYRSWTGRVPPQERIPPEDPAHWHKWRVIGYVRDAKHGSRFTGQAWRRWTAEGWIYMQEK